MSIPRLENGLQEIGLAFPVRTPHAGVGCPDRIFSDFGLPLTPVLHSDHLPSSAFRYEPKIESRSGARPESKVAIHSAVVMTAAKRDCLNPPTLERSNETMLEERGGLADGETAQRVFAPCGPPRISARERGQGGEEMAGRSGEDEKVPSGVEPGFALSQGIEGRAERIGRAAGDQESDGARTGGGREILPDGDDEPAHAEIGDEREDGFSVREERLEDDAGGGDGPYGAEDPPPRCRPQQREAEGGIGGGYEDEDGGMVEYREQAPHPRRGKGVIERGGKVEKDRPGSEDGVGNDVPRVARRGGADDEHDKAGDREKNARAMRHGIGDLRPRPAGH